MDKGLKKELSLFLKNNYVQVFDRKFLRLKACTSIKNEGDCGAKPPVNEVLGKPHVEATRQDLLAQPCMEAPEEKEATLKDVVLNLDESFSEMVFRKIDEKGYNDSDCYKKVGLDRRLFSKFRSVPYYKPSKSTAILMALALELDLDESLDLLSKAGFTLSHSNKFDLIVEFFISKRIFDVDQINQALFDYDQPLLNNLQ